MKKKEKKMFPTAAVLGAQSGILLEKGGMAGIHEVFDHLFPGVMMGFSFLAVAPRVQAELAGQHPTIGVLGPCGPENFEDFLERGLLLFGETMPVEGPL